MLKTKDKYALGLDIGQAISKLILLKKTDTDITIVAVDEFNNRDEGIIGDQEMGAFVNNWLSEKGYLNYDLVLSIPQYMTIAQVSDFPPVSGAQLQQMVEYETQQLSGLSDEAFINGYQQLKPFANFANPVLIAVCRETLIENKLNNLDTEKLKICDLTMDAMALANTYFYTHKGRYPKDQTILLLDVGAEHTRFVIVRNDNILGIGNSLAGGDLFTQALARRESITDMEAERMKQESELIISNEESPLTVAARKFHKELTSAMEGWRFQINDFEELTKISRVLYCGNGAKLKGLPQFIESIFDCESEPLKIPGNDVSSTSDDCIAFGLALHGFEDSQAAFHLSMAPKIILNDTMRRRRFPFLVIAAACLALLMLAASGLKVIKLKKDKSHLKQEIAKLARCKAVIPNIRAMQDQEKTINSMLIPFAIYGNRNRTFVQAIQVLGKHQRPNDWLVLIADHSSYYGTDEDVFVSKGNNSVFNTTVRTEEMTNQITTDNLKPWKTLYVSGFTPRLKENAYKEIRLTVDALNSESDSLFTKVDLLPANDRSQHDYNLSQTWLEIFGMRPFALKLPLKKTTFKK